MDNENTQLGLTEGSADAESTPSVAVPRDIIAERMAARKTTEQPQTPREEQPLEREEQKTETVFEKPVVKLSPILAATTAELQTSAPKESSDQTERETQPTGEKPTQDRGRRYPQHRDRAVETERPEPVATELKLQPTRPDRERREPKPERPNRTERTPRPEAAPSEARVQSNRLERERRNPRAERTDHNRLERTERPDRREAPRDGKPIPKTPETSFARARAMASKTGVSVIIPLYNEQDSLRELTAAAREELFKLCEKKYELIFINDGSTDRSKEILKDIAAASNRNIVLHFRSNLGKSAALSVGFKEAQYGIVITMDADLQDDPREFVNLIAKLDEGYDLVTGWKKKRNDPMSKTAPSKLFNSVTSFFSGLKLHDFNCGLKAYRKQVTDSLDVYGEMHRYLPALAHWQGFRVAEIPVMHHPRKFGKSKFGTSRFFKGFLDLLTIIFTNRYGRRPLHLFGTVGTLFALIGLGINLYVSIEWIRGLTALSNRPILLLGILLILVGVQLISLGLLGEMMVKNSAHNSQIPFSKEKGKPRPDRSQRRTA